MQLHPIRHDTVDSTNERALFAIAEGSARHGDLHLARAQTAGRGRRGRRWHDEPGASVLASVVLLPGAPLRHVEALTMAAGLAVLRTVRALGLAAAELDWPNDLVVHGAKLAGILVESRGYQPDHPHHVVGVGLNVAQREFPAELTAERSVTSLALEGLAPSREDVEARLALELGGALEEAIEDPDGIAGAYLEATGLIGREVEVRCGATSLLGRLRALDLEQGLAVETDGGVTWLALAHIGGVAARD